MHLIGFGRDLDMLMHQATGGRKLDDSAHAMHHLPRKTHAIAVQILTLSTGSARNFHDASHVHSHLGCHVGRHLPWLVDVLLRHLGQLRDPLADVVALQIVVLALQAGSVHPRVDGQLSLRLSRQLNLKKRPLW